MLQLRQTETFRKWERRLTYQKARAMIAARLFRLANGLAGDGAPVGEGVSELRIHYGPVIASTSSAEAGRFSFCSVEATSPHRSGISRQRRSSPSNGTSEMAEKLHDYDPADALKTDEAVEVFLGDAFETGDARYIAKALGVVARAKGMTKIARETGLAREQLYKSLSEHGNPTLETTLAVLKAIGFELTGKRHAA